MSVPSALNSRPLSNSDALEEAIDAALDACDGDTRAALRALIIANSFLEEELSRTRAQLSRGYTRAARSGQAGADR